MKDSRYKEIMEGLGMPDSHSLLAALKQVANEVAQEVALDIEITRLENAFRDAGGYTFSQLAEMLKVDEDMYSKIKISDTYLPSDRDFSMDFGLTGVDPERFQRDLQKTLDLVRATTEGIELRKKVFSHNKKAFEKIKKEIHLTSSGVFNERLMEAAEEYFDLARAAGRVVFPVGGVVDELSLKLMFENKTPTKNAFIERDLRDMNSETFDNLCSYNLFIHSLDDGNDDIVRSMSKYSVFSITNKSSAPYVARAIDSSNKSPSTTLVLASGLVDDMKDVEDMIAENGAAIFKTVKELTEYLKGDSNG